MNEKAERLRKVMADEAFVKSCIEAENEEAVQKLFADKGIEMSLTEIELMADMIGALESGTLTSEQLETLTKDGALSEDELEAAAGGDFDIWGCWKDIKEALLKVDGLYASKASDNIMLAEQMSKLDMAGITSKAASSGIGIGYIIGGVAAGVTAIGALGYGIYDAVRRRW